MADDTRDDEMPQLSAAALQEWSRNVESVMRGIAHALNNRAAALSAVLELSRDPTGGGDDPAATSSILSSELARVGDLARIVRTIGPPRHGSEAFAPKDAAAESLAVLEMHLVQHDCGVSIEASAAPPVRVPRWMFVRSVIALGAAASNGAAGGTGSSGALVRIAIVGDDDWVVTRVDGISARAAELSPYTAELARAMGGEPLDTQCGFRIPSLAALRQREGR